MDNIFVVAGIIAFIFLIVKFIEMRFVEKESKPLKYLIRDALLVYFSVLLGNFVFEQVSPIGEVNRATPVFTGNPEF
jgi:TctA family transporter